MKLSRIAATVAVAWCLCGCNSQTDAQPNGGNAEPQKSISVTLEEFMTEHFSKMQEALPKSLCAENEFGLSCFEVTQEQCLADMSKLAGSCATRIRGTSDLKAVAFTCSERKECSDKGAELGKVLGQRLGSCTGAEFEILHKAKFKQQPCNAFLQRKGIKPAGM